MPPDIGTYCEPFLGSGAVFFALAGGQRSKLSDAIPALINCFDQVREDSSRVADLALSWATDKGAYYDVRAWAPASPAEQAARFIYLNRLCFNGLYRENQRGQFNVPYGRPKASNVVVDGENLELVARRLAHGVAVSVGDFEDALADCRPGDFVYLDPPYVAGHRANGFVDYNAKL